ncbi:hypothetical protein V2J09_001329 [Rumex salicifolius]
MLSLVQPIVKGGLVATNGDIHRRNRSTKPPPAVSSYSSRTAEPGKYQLLPTPLPHTGHTYAPPCQTAKASSGFIPSKEPEERTDSAIYIDKSFRFGS